MIDIEHILPGPPDAFKTKRNQKLWVKPNPVPSAPSQTHKANLKTVTEEEGELTFYPEPLV